MILLHWMNISKLAFRLWTWSCLDRTGQQPWPLVHRVQESCRARAPEVFTIIASDSGNEVLCLLRSGEKLSWPWRFAQVRMLRVVRLEVWGTELWALEKVDASPSRALLKACASDPRLAGIS